MSSTIVYSTAWSISKSPKKSEFDSPTKNANPGPGAYSPISRKSATANDWRPQTGHKPLYNNLESPAPGRYDPKLQDKVKTTKIVHGNRSPNVKKSEAPGPGQYDLKETTSNKKILFTPRRPDRVDTVPGPGTYDQKSAFASNQSTAAKSAGIGKGSRPDWFVKNDDAAPGPGLYQSPTSFSKRGTDFHTPAKDHYLDRVIKDASSIPAPGSYNVSGRNSSPVTRMSGVGHRDNFVLKTEGNGPATYNPDHQRIGSSQSGCKFSSLPRDMYDREAIMKPGPGTYSPEKSSPMRSVNKDLIGRGSQRNLFDGMLNITSPGPAQYQQTESKLEAPTHSFGSRLEDLELKAKRAIPGPGEYSTPVKESVKSKLIKEYHDNGHCPEKWLSVAKDTESAGFYNLPAEKSVTYSFAKGKRDLHGKSDAPGPGQYNKPKLLGNVPSYVRMTGA